jgi:hypothetical protein
LGYSRISGFVEQRNVRRHAGLQRSDLLPHVQRALTDQAASIPDEFGISTYLHRL